MFHIFQANTKLLYYVSVIAVGGAVQGVDIGVIATTLGLESFNTYMFPPGTTNESSLVGAIVAMSQAGMIIGCLFTGMLLEKYGRRMTLVLSTFFTIVGAVMQSAANGPALMIVGRCVAGIAIGGLMGTCPAYIAELAKPEERARFGAVFGMAIATGFCVANWIGYGCSYATGDAAWRLALAMQIPLAVFILVFSWTLPESPRWLVQKERYTQFLTDMRRLYSEESDESIRRHQAEITAQLQLEASQRTNRHVGHAIIELFSRQNIHRTATAIIIMQIIIFSGALAIQNYQSLLYASLGFSGKEALLVSGCYGFMGIVGQIINLLLIADRWPRVRTLWVGCISIAACISILMALSRYYGDGSNINGARAGVAFIFMQSVLYASFFNATVFTIPAEYFPAHLRGYGTSLAFLCQSVTGVWLGQVTPIAFENITYRYYLIFICTLVALAFFCFFCVKETNQLTLESIAGNFGDKTVVIEKAIGIAEELERSKAEESKAAA